MKTITLFHLQNCPYCGYARKALEALKDENPAYGEIEVEWIEESKEPEKTAGFDDDYVPTIFFEGRKLYEAHPSEDYEACKKNVKAALDAVLSGK